VPLNVEINPLTKSLPARYRENRRDFMSVFNQITADQAAEMINSVIVSIDGQDVKSLHNVTPPAAGISMVYRADRRRDPAPIHTLSG
jgi:hypothetical protein